VKSPTFERLEPVAVQILGYLGTHCDAQDTVEGIAEWWLLEQRVRHVITEVKQGLDELMVQGIVLENRGQDGHVRYRLNKRKRAAVEQYLKERSSEPDAFGRRLTAEQGTDEAPQDQH
jgi:hypothetical protein